MNNAKPATGAGARGESKSLRIGRVVGSAALACGLAGLLIYARTAASQQQPSPAERFAKMSADADAKGLAEPFKGITTDGTPEAGLFPVKSTGVSTEPVRTAAEAFLAAL